MKKTNTIKVDRVKLLGWSLEAIGAKMSDYANRMNDCEYGSKAYEINKSIRDSAAEDFEMVKAEYMAVRNLDENFNELVPDTMLDNYDSMVNHALSQHETAVTMLAEYEAKNLFGKYDDYVSHYSTQVKSWARELDVCKEWREIALEVARKDTRKAVLDMSCKRELIRDTHNLPVDIFDTMLHTLRAYRVCTVEHSEARGWRVVTGACIMSNELRETKGYRTVCRIKDTDVYTDNQRKANYAVEFKGYLAGND